MKCVHKQNSSHTKGEKIFRNWRDFKALFPKLIIKIIIIRRRRKKENIRKLILVRVREEMLIARVLLTYLDRTSKEK